MDKWKTIKDDGLPPVGSCLIVTIKNHGYGGRRELRYPVHYLEKNYAPGYAFYMNGTDILYQNTAKLWHGCTFQRLMRENEICE